MHKLGTPSYGYVYLLKGFDPQALHDCAAEQVDGMITLQNANRVYELVTNTCLFLEDEKIWEVLELKQKWGCLCLQHRQEAETCHCLLLLWTDRCGQKSWSKPPVQCVRTAKWRSKVAARAEEWRDHLDRAGHGRRSAAHNIPWRVVTTVADKMVW